MATSAQHKMSEQGFWALYAALPVLSATSKSILRSSENGESYNVAEAGTISLLNACLVMGAMVCVSIAIALIRWASPGGPAWGRVARSGRPETKPIPGPRGLPFIGSLLSLGPLAHRTLLHFSHTHSALPLLALSLANTRLIVASLPSSAKEILTSPCFADRPLKESAKQLLFDRAIGFAPYGDYWRKLRRIAASHLFSPRRIAEHEVHRQAEVQFMIDTISKILQTSADNTVNQNAVDSKLQGSSAVVPMQSSKQVSSTVINKKNQGALTFSEVSVAGILRSHIQHQYDHKAKIMQSFEVRDAKALQSSVLLRPFLQQAALNNVMITVFGKRYDFLDSECKEAIELQSMVREGFELLGAFNLADHLPAFQAFDSQCIKPRCEALVPRVNAFVSEIIRQHRQALLEMTPDAGSSLCTDFVHVLIGMQHEEGLSDADIVAILWEMIFRGTDSVAILLEWILAELVLHPEIQQKLAFEINNVVGADKVCDADIARLPYLQAVVFETLRLHPPGPLLSWARLAIHDTEIAGHHIPAGTTAMVNMWAISHDPSIWSDPLAFTPERFLGSTGAGPNFDIRGSDLRLAPFGAGRRVCPGRALGLATVNLWLARLVQQFVFTPDPAHVVDLSEFLKLSCEMRNPLVACISERSAFTPAA